MGRITDAPTSWIEISCGQAILGGEDCNVPSRLGVIRENSASLISYRGLRRKMI
jgi:hypothetical protein